MGPDGLRDLPRPQGQSVGTRRDIRLTSGRRQCTRSLEGLQRDIPGHLPSPLPGGDAAGENGLPPVEPVGSLGDLELLTHPLCLLAFSSVKWG